MRVSTTFLALTLLLLMGAPAAESEAEEAAVYTIVMNYEITNKGPGEAENVRMIIYLFDNISGWAEQTVLSESFEGVHAFLSEPQSTADNRWVRISVGDLQEGETKTVSVTQVLKVKAVDLRIDPNLVDRSFPQELVDAFTSQVNGLWESDHPTIKDLAQRLTENTDNPYYQARQIFDFVVEEENERELTYTRLVDEHSALWGLEEGYGDCTEFSNLFVALARASGIPAKIVSGYGYLPLYAPTGVGDLNAMAHAYAIFYLPKVGEDYGWVPVDAVWPRYTGSFGKMDYAHLAGATTGGEGVVRNGWIWWPGPGLVEEPYLTFRDRGPGPEVDFPPATGTITPEILLDVSLRTTPQIEENGAWTVTVTTKNTGRITARNLTTELDLDSDFFEVVSGPQQRSSLASGGEWSATYDVVVKENAYGREHLLVAKVTFSSTYNGVTGTFLARGELQQSIGEKPEPYLPSLPEIISDPIILLSLICLVAVIGVLVVVIIHR